MKTMRCGSYEVTTDGRTVWVNDEQRCLGRFCQSSAEALALCPDGRSDLVTYEMFATGPTDGNWKRFVGKMEAIGCVVPKDYMPGYVMPDEEVSNG